MVEPDLPLQGYLTLSRAAALALVLSAIAPTAESNSDAAMFREGALLADRIFSEAGLAPAGDERCALIHDITDVLRRIRETHADMAAITARQHEVPGVLIVVLSPQLLQAVKGGHHEEFDRLGTSLGLTSVSILDGSGTAVLTFGSDLDVAAAASAYGALEGIIHAAPDQVVGDGPDVLVARHEDVWHVTFREAWGDCPSGCIFERLTSFEVTVDRVRRILP